MSDGLDPAPLPEGLGLAAEDWQQTPTSVRHQVISLSNALRPSKLVSTRLLQLQSAALYKCTLNKAPTTDENHRPTPPWRQTRASWACAGSVRIHGHRRALSRGLCLWASWACGTDHLSHASGHRVMTLPQSGRLDGGEQPQGLPDYSKSTPYALKAFIDRRL